MSIIESIKKCLPEATEAEMKIFEHFLDITRVPRGSKHHEPIVKYLGETASKFGFAHSIDAYNNLLVTIPATAGCESIPAVCIQAHSDMVCVSKDTSFDFKTRAIDVRLKDFYEDGRQWIMGTDTTLGADNGVGIAYAFALCEEIKSGAMPQHPKIYILVTSDEEIGLVGASKMLEHNPEFFPSDVGYLINADSEDFGHICISSCGGARHDVAFNNLEVAEFDGMRTFELNFSNLTSGHSGADIQLMRANAMKLAGRVIETLLQECEECARPNFHFVKIAAGTTHNAIPSHACITFGFTEFKDECCKWVIETVEKAISDCKACYDVTDPNMVGTIAEVDYKGPALATKDSQKILDFINIVPAGVIRMSRKVDGLVESSYNPAVVSLNLEKAEFHMMGSGRSCVDTELDEIYRRINQAARLCGATEVKQSSRYPGWPANPDSKLLKILKEKYAKYDDKVVVEAIHAGLEVGMLVAGRDIQAVSVGPTILSPHSVVERMDLATVIPVYKILKETILDLLN